MLGLRSNVMDQCFVRDYEKAHNSSGLQLNKAKYFFEVVPQIHLWSNVSKRGTHIADSVLFPKCTSKIEIPETCDILITMEIQ